MNTTWLVILAIVIVAIVFGLIVFVRRRRSESLRKHFGPEYKRTVDRYGNQRKAEAELAAREKRVRKFEIRSLAPEEQSRFAEAWKKTQARFVDEPSQAVGEADGLVKEMTTVGAGAKFDKGTYRVSAGLHGMGAKAVTALSEWTEAEVRRNGRTYRQEYARGKATTEDLRQAMVHYRSLFEELLAEPTTPKEAVR